MKKFVILGILFLLPIIAYLFFSSGINHFAKLPILTKNVLEIDQFKTENGASKLLKDHITILCFFGNNLELSKANAFNLAHKIYKKNYQFKDFQFVILTPDGSQFQVKSLKEELSEIENAVNWNFVYSSPNEIEKVFNSLGSNYSLDANMASPYVFIIDKDRSLRGRDDDDDLGLLYGFDSSDYSEVNNKMSDDVRVILAEYRLALKKYNSKREI
ncbi:MAG: hypothetical protein HOF75_00330 [Flavobacteriaceae bacterium]|nr:hypothetical protein [Flavobacteriaceae bacterium]MBT3918980.1 hypothetical protein [Flavobacteriaceae bacterium]MBT6704898.1 hypothetical protein [Flavobacteriaceae bacterium]